MEYRYVPFTNSFPFASENRNINNEKVLITNKIPLMATTAIKISSDVVQCSDIYIFKENYTRYTLSFPLLLYGTSTLFPPQRKKTRREKKSRKPIVIESNRGIHKRSIYELRKKFNIPKEPSEVWNRRTDNKMFKRKRTRRETMVDTLHKDWPTWIIKSIECRIKRCFAYKVLSRRTMLCAMIWKQITGSAESCLQHQQLFKIVKWMWCNFSYTYSILLRTILN